MNNTQIMERLDWLQENDPTNNEVYDLVVMLTENLIKNEKWVMQPADFDNITHDVAADVYTVVSNERYKIQFWRAYISRILKMCRVPRQRKATKQQVFDTNLDPVAKKIFISSFVSKMDNTLSIERIENKMLFENIYEIANSILDETKFWDDMTKRQSLLISVALSLRDNKIVQFHTTDEMKPYVNILVSKIKQNLCEACISSAGACDEVAFNTLYTSELYQNDSGSEVTD